MSKEESALLAAVYADPKDNGPRLIYADWLDEHGRNDRAEFIRLQCAMKKEPIDADHVIALHTRLIELIHANPSLRRSLAHHAFAVDPDYRSDRFCDYLQLIQDEAPSAIASLIDHYDNAPWYLAISLLINQYDRGFHSSSRAEIRLVSNPIHDGQRTYDVNQLAIDAVNRSEEVITGLMFECRSFQLRHGHQEFYRLIPENIARITKTGIEEVEFFLRFAEAAPFVAALGENPVFSDVKRLRLIAEGYPDDNDVTPFLDTCRQVNYLQRLELADSFGMSSEAIRALMNSKMLAHTVIDFDQDNFELYKRNKTIFHHLSRDDARALRYHNEAAADHHGITYHPSDLLATQLNKTRSWGEYLTWREYVKPKQEIGK